MKKFKKYIRLGSMVVLVLVGICMGMSLMGFEGKTLALGLPFAFAAPFMLGVVTFDGTNGVTDKYSAHGPISAVGRVYQLMNRVTIPLTAVTNDIVTSVPVKKGTRVLTTAMRLVTKSNGSAMTLKLGDGDATGGYQNTTMDAVGGAVGLTQTMLPADTNGVTPKVYTADDTVDILLAGVTAQSTTAAVVDVMVLCEDLTADPGDYTSPVVAGSTT